jgi:uncharacterized protein YcaQ
VPSGPSPQRRLTRAQARRIALAAQGFAAPRAGDGAAAAPNDRRGLARVVRRTNLLQIDSVNVLVRAHYLPAFSRLGPYSTAALDRAAARPPRTLFEYWGHEASLLPVSLHPFLRWRMAAVHDHAWGGMRTVAREQPELVSEVKAAVAALGPVPAAGVELALGRTGGPRRNDWGWRWGEVKHAVEYLFWSGEITAARRGSGFERWYDLPGRVLPPAVLAAPTPAPEDAHRELVRRAAGSHGVASFGCLRDYFRQPTEQVRTAVAELVEAGELVPVQVEGWHRPAYLHRDVRVPRRVDARALLAPFDPLVFERARTEALFDFRYRIEIYVPAPQRRHGYYVLPFLLGDALVARVDLKADRQRGVLLVQGAFAEPDAPGETARELAEELTLLAGWLGLTGVEVAERGDLAARLAQAIGRPATG